MNAITDRLLAMLCNRGLTDREIPWLVRDVLNIINHNPVFALEHLNWKLSTLGWDEDLFSWTATCSSSCSTSSRTT